MIISPLLCLLLLLFFSNIRPFLSFSCSVNSTSSEPCKAYVTYRAQEPSYLDVGKISDLFGVSRLEIAEASNLASEDDTLNPDQLLLIPLPCACVADRYFANVTYDIQKGDSFYFLSSTVFQNLTTWQVVEEMNPRLNPNLLSIGVKVTIPLFCKCPDSDQEEEGTEYVITYVWRPNDSVSEVAGKFGATESNIYGENNGLRSFDEAIVGTPLLIPVSELPTLLQPNNLKATERSPTSIRNPNNKRRIIIIICSVIGVAIFVSVLVAITVHVRFSQKRANLRAMEPDHSNSTVQFINLSYAKILRCKFSPTETADSISIRQRDCSIKEDKLLHGVSDFILRKPIAYEYGAIMEATVNFSEKFKVKGRVYKAVIGGKLLAVKRMKEGEVSEEVEILQRVNHANLVKLMGVASCGEFFVYEFAENGSLDNWLFSSSGPIFTLTWTQRVQIALDVANGLQYLHEHTQPSILHGDIRSSNILLDASFKAKLSNFSRARSASTLPTSLKADVFGFGVVILELLSGKKAGGNYKEATLLDDGEEEKRNDRLRDWMDPNLKGFYDMEGALSLANLARVCTLEDSRLRPCMAEIVFNLCVLTQSAAETAAQIGDDAIQVINPVVAR